MQKRFHTLSILGALLTLGDALVTLPVASQSKSCVQAGTLTRSSSANNVPDLRIQLGHALVRAERILATSTFLGGALAGGLHAITGPDHYPALLPRCVGQRWHTAGKVGAVWGVGHALSAMLMGLLAFMIKDRAFVPGGVLSKVSLGADLAVGLSLVFVGFLSIQESHGLDFRKEMGRGLSADEEAVKADILINGLFHGLAIDGLPTIMPVLGAGSLQAAVSFLISYGMGTTCAMVAATIFIGQGTMSLAKTTDFDLARLIHGSAIGAVFVGLVWTGKALLSV